jgi:hypothetical protein
MNKLAREFVSQDERQFPVKVGHHLASSLSGFIAGVAVASIAWIAGWMVFKMLFPGIF